MLDRYTLIAVTLADLIYEPFPDVTKALSELADSAVRLATRLAKTPPKQATEVPQDSPQPSGIIQCEGRDLNPHASYGASTSS
jgi:hypothetical protein